MSDDTQDIQDSSGQTLDQQSNPAQTLDQQTNPMQQAQTPPQAQPQQPTAQTPQAAPQGQTPQTAPQAGQQPQSDHAKWFNKVFEVASGGPVRYTKTNPTTGEVTQVVQHRPMKAMAASILAGAVAGMMGGLQAPDKLNQFGQRDLSGAAQAGGQAGQQVANAPSQQAQKMSDQQLGAALATTDHNLKLHAQHVADTKLEGENADAAYKRIQQQANDASPILASMDATYKDLNLPNTSQEMSGDELERRMVKGDIHVAKDSAFIIGSKPIIGENGQITGYMPQYRVYDPTAKVQITDDIKKAYPRFATVADGQMIPIQGFYRDYNQKQNDRFAKSFGNQLEQDFNDAGIPVKAGAFNSVLPQLTKYSAAIAGQEPDQIPGALKAAGASQSLVNQLVNLYPQGYKPETFSDKRAADKKAEVDTAARELRQQEASDKANTPEGKLDLQKKQLEVQQKQRELDSANLSSAGLAVPKGFTPNPNAAQMESVDLQKDLQTKGVRIPANFESLYAVAHNAADLKTLPSNPRKGSNQMSSQEGLAFIRQYINPQYQEGDYAAASGLSKELASTRQGTAGGSLLSAGVASNHLELLDQAATALQNNDTQALNKVANALGVQFGKSPAVTFNAIADQVNGEVGKVVAGGTPHEAELANLRKNLNTDQSPEQTKNVIKSYIGLMSGRVNEINDRSQQYFGRDVKGVSPSVMRVFNKYGFAVGSQQQYTLPSGKQIFFPNKAALDSFKQKAGLQ
jgi:hypothetical protein